MNDMTTNLNAECALLGCLLLDEKREFFPAVRDILRDQYYFSKPEHRILYDALCRLDETAEGVLDLVRVRDALKQAGSLDAVGGMKYVISLVETLPTAANAVYYARLVEVAYKRRRIAEHGEVLRRAAEEPGDVHEVLHDVKRDLDDLADDVSDKTPVDGSEAVKTLIDDSIAQRRQIIRMPWSMISRLTAALQPGTVTVLCGSPGASKSFAALELLAFVLDDHPAAYFALEDSKGFHLMRLLALKTELPGLTNPDWIAAHASIAEAAHAENADWLRRIGRAIDADGGGQVTYDSLICWALRRARAGCKLLIIDPATAVQHQTRQSWNEDNVFLQNVKRIGVDYGVAVLLVTHPAKTTPKPEMQSLAGGAAFSRFSQTIIWLDAHGPRESNVKYSVGAMDTPHNRTIHLLKTRLGKGHGLRIAATFTDTLHLIEHGIIVKRPAKGDAE